MATGLLGISLSGLNSAQAGIRTAQHNISNINTAGFRRQEVDYTSLTPTFTGAGIFGTGAGVSAVRALYSQFQDSQVMLNQAQLSRNQSFATQATQVDSLTSDANSGLTSAMSKFFDAAQTVASDPTSNAARQVMLSAGRNLASRFSTLATAFNDMRADSNREIASMVTRINTFAGKIAETNSNILRFEAVSGQPANDLRDQRDQLVTELNKLINVTPVQQADGAFNVFVGNGQPLVVGSNVSPMVSMNDVTHPQFEVPTLIQAGGNMLVLEASMVTGGQLGGLLAAREQVLMPAMQDLDALAYQFATRFNAQHNAGFDKNGAAGTAFFADLSGLTSPFTGAAMSMSVAVGMDDPDLIAASATAAGSPGDNNNALALAELRTQANTVGSDTFLGAYSQIVLRTATLAAEADVGVAAFETLTRMSTQARQSVSGVNLDEEAANLIRFQQAYQASARAMQISSSLFNDLLSSLR